MYATSGMKSLQANAVFMRLDAISFGVRKQVPEVDLGIQRAGNKLIVYDMRDAWRKGRKKQ